MKTLKKPGLKSRILLSLLCATCNTSPAMQSLTDDDMADVAGQALFSANYIAPSAGGNPSSTVGFYRLGVEASMELNANINQLRLGCDGKGTTNGVLGGGTCDISIDHLRLTGIGSSEASDSGPGTDFKLNNPYFEFAIENPTNAATRQVVGIRFGSQSALGVLSIGENYNLTNTSDDTGINRFSGDMTAIVTNATLTNVRACLGILVFGACIGGWLTGSATVASHSQAVSGKRLTQIDIGPMSAQASGSLLGLTLNNTHLVGQQLDTVHQLVIAADAAGTVPTTDFYLSLQSKNVTWQKVSTANFTGAIPAQAGWWMSVPRVQIANATSNQQISMSGLGALAGAIFNSRVEIDGIDLGQRPVDNCWGSSAFC